MADGSKTLPGVTDPPNNPWGTTGVFGSLEVHLIGGAIVPVAVFPPEGYWFELVDWNDLA